jgi:predicted O-methyltransferase YrrM
MRPKLIIETGVGHGFSTGAILLALHENNHGTLVSIEKEGVVSSAELGEDPDYVAMRTRGRQPGWIIPAELKDRWQLVSGSTREKLGVTLGTWGEIDIFHHDSDHSYENMSFEFATAWPFIRRGGLLLSDNVDLNSAFADFCQTQHLSSFQVSELGAVKKT